MDPILLSIIVVIVAVLGAAAWMDFKRRRLDDTKSSGAMGHDRNATRASAKDKGAQWGAGGG